MYKRQQYSPAETDSLGYDVPRMIVRGDKFPTGTAQWAARVKRWAPALEDCAGLEVAASPKITSITPADAEHRGYSSAAITHELTSGEIISISYYSIFNVFQQSCFHMIL